MDCKSFSETLKGDGTQVNRNGKIKQNKQIGPMIL